MNVKMINDFVLMFKFNDVDTDGNGVLDIDEFLTCFIPQVSRQIFQKYDPTGTGVVPIEDLGTMLLEFGFNKADRAKLDKIYEKCQFGSTCDYNQFYYICKHVHAKEDAAS